MLDSFLPTIPERKSAPPLRQPAPVARSASLDTFEPGLRPSASPAISEAELASSQRVFKCRQLLRNLNVSFYEDYGRGISTDSADGFLKLVKHFEPTGTQSLGAESTGRIVATWRQDEDALTLEFLTPFTLKYAITVTENGNVIRRWGSQHLLTFLAAEPLAARFVKGI